MKGLDMTQDINRAGASALRKRSLLGSTALVAATAAIVSASGAAYGGNLNPAGGTALAVTAKDTIVDHGSNPFEVSVEDTETLGSASVPGIIIDTTSNQVGYIYSSDADDAIFNIDGAIGIAASKTLTLNIADDADSGAGVDGNLTVNINNFIGGIKSGQPDASERGGNLTIKAKIASQAATDKYIVNTTAGMKIETLALEGGAATANGSASGAADGTALTVNLGDGADDVLDVEKFTATGGAASASGTAKAGGELTVVVNGTLTIAEGEAESIVVTGGAAGTGAGGSSTVTIKSALGNGTGKGAGGIDGKIVVTGANASASLNGHGGAATLNLEGAVNITTDVEVTGGVINIADTKANGGLATLTAKESFKTTGDIKITGGGLNSTGTNADAKNSQSGNAVATFEKDVEAENLEIKGIAGVVTGSSTADPGDATVTLKGNAKFDDIKLTSGSTQGDSDGGDASLLIAGEGDQIIDANISGTMGGSNADGVKVTNSNVKGVVTFKKPIGKTSDDTPVANNDIIITLDEGTKTVFESTVNADQAFTINGGSAVTFNETVDLDFAGAGLIMTGVTVAKKLTFTVGAGFSYGDKDTASDTVIDISVSSGDYTGSAVAKSITLKLPSEFVSGHLVLIKTDQANVSDAEVAAFEVTDTIFADYTVSKGGSDFSGTLAAKDIVVSAKEYGEADVAKQLAAIGVTNAAFAPVIIQARKAVVSTTGTGEAEKKTDAALEEAFNEVLVSGDKAKITKLVEQAAVQTDTLGAVVGATAGAGASSFGVVTERLASLRTGGALGIATGDHVHANGKSVYVKAFGDSTSQDDDGGVKGFSATTFGTAFGVDGEISEGSVLGASFSVSSSEVEGDGTGKSELDISNYQANVYGQVDVGGFFVDGMFGYGWSSIDSTRKIEVGTIKEAKADYDGKILMAALGASVPVDLSGASLTPRASFTYTNVSYDSYTETGASTLSQKIAQDDVASGLLQLGATVQTSSEGTDGFVITPSLRAGVFYDLIGDEAKATANYTGGGSSFGVKGAGVEKFGGTVGVGLMGSKDNLSLSANYDATLKSGYTAHSGELKLSVGF
jgi:uncharacterized protein with beta-barrel porin domain